MKKVLIGLAIAGMIPMSAPIASASGWKQDPADACAYLAPADRMPCEFKRQQALHPDLGNKGTGGPAHNICQITGHDC
jgi:hypothetical protein